jgi:Kef-type K+ transport system membrane component KefB
MAAAVLVASMVSIELGVSVALLEILLGVVIGNATETDIPSWFAFIGSFAPIVLAFLAGSETDATQLRREWRSSFLLGGVSFLFPFGVVYAGTHHLLGWEPRQGLIAATALATTSVAIVYTVLLETGIAGTPLGKRLMAATFVTDFLTAMTLSLVFVRPSWWLVPFTLVSIGAVLLVPVLFPWFFRRYGSTVVEPEIKLVFAGLFVLMWLGERAHAHAVLPAFVLGLILSRHYGENTHELERLRVVSFAFLTPFFFMKSGMRVSLDVLWANLGVLGVLFGMKMASKLTLYPLIRRAARRDAVFGTLLMSTGLTFGTIAALYGLSSGIIGERKFSLLVAVVVLSALVPTTVAQVFFRPRA